MKKLLFIPFIAIAFSGTAQNSLLSSPTTGNLFAAGSIVDIEIVSNGTDVALIAVNEFANDFYAIDIQDNDYSDAAGNLITTVPDFQSLMNGAVGGTFTLINFEVNPISKAVYILGTSSGDSYILKLTQNGATVEVLDFTNMTFSTINWSSTSFGAQDLTFGNDTLYITSGGWPLDGEIGYIGAPFVHNSTVSDRSTTMFKTNWGGNYFTDAPLEKLDFATINGENRLVGVTVCAPGFSVKTSDVPGTGLLSVTEDFNINFSPSKKCVHQTNGGKNWLFDLHNGWGTPLVRIGEEYLDGSVIGANEYNNNAQLLRDGGGAVTAGLTDDQVKIYPQTYDMIAFWNDHNLLVLESDTLKLFDTGGWAVTIDEDELASIQVYPNPASDYIEIAHQYSNADVTIKLFNAQGEELGLNPVSNQENVIKLDVSELSKGSYVLQIFNNNEAIKSEKIILN